MGAKATETKINETCAVKANTSADEIISKTVLLLERYCQWQACMVAKNLPVDTSHHGATRAILPVKIEETDCPIDDGIGFWQAEALSVRKSAWEGKLLETFLAAFHSR
jgi:hypothetical protein